MKSNSFIYLVFIGIIYIAMSFGDDSQDLFSNELELIFGIILIATAIFLTIKNKKKDGVSKFENIPIRKSYIYILIGILFIKGIATNKSLLSFFSIDNVYVILLLMAIGMIITIYGLRLFFQEKKQIKNNE